MSVELNLQLWNRLGGITPFAALPLKNSLAGSGGLGIGSLSRVSAATYTDSDGTLQTSWGDRDQLIPTNAQENIANWTSDRLVHIDSDDQGDSARGVWGDGSFIYLANDTGGLHSYSVDGSGNLTHIDSDDQGDYALGVWGDGSFIYLANDTGGLHSYSVGYELVIAVTVPNTYLLSTHTAGQQVFASADTATISSNGSALYNDGFAFTCTGDGDVAVNIVDTSPKVMLEQLPSGNVIGDDLFDQETTTARIESADTVVGTIYRIVTQNTLDFTTVGAPDNTVGTVFIATAVDTLGAEDALAEITSPHKGTYGWPYSAGAEAITDSDDRDFAGGDIGNWTVTANGSGTLAYDTTDIGGADDKQGLLTSSGDSYLYANLPTADSSLSANTLYRIEAKMYVPAANTLKDVLIGTGSLDGAFRAGTSNVTLAGDTWTTVHEYEWVAADITGVIPRMGFSGNPADGDLLYFDDVSIRPIQTSWVPQGTNTIEIDETTDQLVITYVDDDKGASLTLADATDLSDDLVSGNFYLVTLTDVEADNGDVDIEIAEADDTQLASLTITGDAAADDYEIVYQCVNAATDKIQFDNMAATEVVRIGTITIKQIPPLALLEPSDFVNSATIPAKPRFTADGLLIEGSGTNLIPYSEDFTQWTTSNITDTIGISGPDNGVANATTLTAAAANGTIKYTLASTVGAAVETFSIWMKRITGTGNIDMTVNNGGAWTTKTLTTSWQRFDIAGTETAPVVGIRIVADTDAIGVYGADLKAQNYLSSYIPTNGSMVSRSTEAGAVGVSGYSWTLPTSIRNVLDNTLPGGGATPAIGTLVVKWKALQDYDAVDTNPRGFVGVANSYASLLGFKSSEGDLNSRDGTNIAGCDNVDWSEDDDLISVARWDSTADGGSGYLHVSNKKNSIWDYNVGNETAFDGAFTGGVYLLLSISNELPIAIKSISFYDTYVADADLPLL